MILAPCGTSILILNQFTSPHIVAVTFHLLSPTYLPETRSLMTPLLEATAKTKLLYCTRRQYICFVPSQIDCSKILCSISSLLSNLFTTRSVLDANLETNPLHVQCHAVYSLDRTYLDDENVEHYTLLQESTLQVLV